MTKEFKNIGIDQLEEVIDAILTIGEDYPIWTFEGNLGTGKTTLIKALAAKLDIKDPVSSPTFNYVNVYDHKVYHFDCYRLNKLEEVLNLGLEEYLDSGEMCWVEWPEVIKPLLDSGYTEIKILNNSENTRDYFISIN